MSAWPRERAVAQVGSMAAAHVDRRDRRRAEQHAGPAVHRTGFTLGPMSFGVGIGKVGACIDVSGYTGLTFWAKGNTTLSVELDPAVAALDTPTTAVGTFEIDIDDIHFSEN
jgi:hypothetical protein